MKKILNIALTLAGGLLLFSCQPEDLPKADYLRAEVNNLTATAGDEKADLKWSPAEGFAPKGYIVTWGTASKQELASDKTSYTVTGLANDTKYSFSVQAVYEAGISGAVTVSAIPKTTRFAVESLTATAANATAVLWWTKPSADVQGYTVVYTPGEVTTKIPASVENYTFDNLENDVTYTFTMVANYANGDSQATTVKVMPSVGKPYTIDRNTVGANQPVQFTVNPESYEAAITSIEWDFGDGTKSNEQSVSHGFESAGTASVKLNVTMANGNTKNYTIEITVNQYVVSFNDYKLDAAVTFSGSKASVPAFSKDGKTVYTATFAKPGGLYAIDIETNTLKWSFVSELNSAAYGAAPVVNPQNGDIYFGTAASGEFYAIKSDGSKHWSFTTIGAMNKCFPAVGSNGTVYICDGGGNLYAIDEGAGTQKWTTTLVGTPGGIMVNGSELIVGTSANLYFVNASTGAISQTIDISAWKGMTDLTGFAASPDKQTIYFCCKGGFGLVAVDLTSHATKQFAPVTGMGDAYTPVVGASGTIYFGTKTSDTNERETFFAVNPDMTVKWSIKTKVKNVFNYCSPVVDASERVYAASNDRKVYQFDGATGAILKTLDTQQNMSGLNTLNGVVYLASIGSAGDNGRLIGIYTGAERAASWCSRGGDQFGTGCLK